MTRTAITPQVDVEGMRMHYRRAGTGPIVLLLHGGLATGSLAWRSWYKPLSKSHTVIAPDIRGHGRTDNPAGCFLGFGALAWDMLRFLEAIGANQPVQIVAHSCGALIALHMSIYDPGRVARQVLIGAQPFLGQSPRYAAALRRAFGARDLDVSPNPLFFFRHNVIDGLALALAHRQTAPWRLFRQIWPLRVRALRLEPSDYAKITAPTLLLMGERDPFVSLAETERLCHLLKDARVQALPKHDHFSAVHDRDVLQDWVIPYLD